MFHRTFTLSLSLFFATASLARAEEPFDYNKYESAARPVPAWVKMVDLGAKDPALKGYRAPAGVKVEVVATEKEVLNPVGMRFDDDGSLLAIQWNVGQSVDMTDTTITMKDGSKVPTNLWIKNVPDTLKRLIDSDGDGKFDKSEVVMNDLQLPSSILLHDGWIYYTTRGGVTRRKQSKPGPGNPYDVTERLVQGFCGFNQHQASGLSMSADGWIYITHGDDDSHVEAVDGTRASLLRCGGVWRMRPDGSGLTLVARGFRNPYRDVVFDAFGNIFHVDNDNEDGSKFQGCRLMHVMEEADYGWRLKPTVRCCWPDADRGAIWGEKPGRMPSMLKTGRGAPAGLLCYQGLAFPEKLFHGLLIYPDVFQKNVRAYRTDRDGSTFKVTEQFTLLESDDGPFRPCQALQGPDGAIYLCDWRTNSAGPAAAWGDGKSGRIWRLSWEGTPEEPAIARGKMDAWAKLATAMPTELVIALESKDGGLRSRAIEALAARRENQDGIRHSLCAMSIDETKSPATRAAALSSACRMWNADVEKAAMSIVKNPNNADLRQLAAELLGRNVRAEEFAGDHHPDEIILALDTGLHDRTPSVQRASALALARISTLASDKSSIKSKLATELGQILLKDDRKDRYLHDGLLRAVERLGPVGLNEFVSDAVADEEVARESGIGELESLRTREGADAINRVLHQGKSLTPEQTARLLTAYRYIQTDPAVDPAPLATWLEAHADAPPAQQVAALESIALMGQSDSDRVLPIVLKLLKNPSEPLRRASVKVIGDQRLIPAAKPLAEALKDNSRSIDERKQILVVLATLRGERRFAQVVYDPGVLGCTDEIAAVASDDKAGALRTDALGVLAQIDFAKAKPLAMKLLESGDVDGINAAINTLGADPNGARDIAKRFLDGKLKPESQGAVASALQRHIVGNTAAEFTDLRAKVMKSGLSIKDDPQAMKKLEELAIHGNADRGKAVFADTKKAACATCHRVNGVGGQIGPDLTGIGKNSNAAKLIESIVDPSKEIKEGFEQYLIRTKAGQTYAGYKVSSDDNRVVLRDTAGKDITLPRGDVDREVKSKLSLMPDGAYSGLSMEELADLITFLSKS